MPWTPDDAPRHTKKAKSPKAKRQWRDIANEALARTGDEGLAVREANSAVAKRFKKPKGRARFKSSRA